MKNICRLVAILTIIGGITGGSITAMAASFGQLTAYGIDTLAGYSALLSTSRTYPNADIFFSVTKPDGAKIDIQAKTDESGVAKVDLYDYHTRRAGKYSVAARFSTETTDGTSSYFNVFPDQVSLEQSVVAANKNIAKADGGDTVYVSVSVRDQYGNPFKGHLTSLISSRSEDIISSTSLNSATDENGSVTYMVASEKAGVSIFSAVDSTSGVVFSGRTQVAFLNGNSTIQDAGGDLRYFIPSAQAADAGPLYQFEISDIPAGIQPNQNVSFRVTAQDADDITVENYTGTIHFSIEGSGGDSVNLPEDYTFKAEDLGTHSFGLGLSFTKTGTYTIVVTDINNTMIDGKISVTVGSGGSTQNTQQGTGFAPIITIPAPGSYSLSEQTISGTAQPGSTIKIHDNEQEIGSVQTGSDGKFTFQTNPLSDGTHSIYVVSMDAALNIIGTSATVAIIVDTTPPLVDEIQLEPSSDIKPGTIIDVKIFSEENISSGALIFNGEITNLNGAPGQPGTYAAQITAPAETGAYGLDVVLADQLNNEGSYQAKATVNVSAEGGTIDTPIITQETQTTETQQTQIESDNEAPAQVFGVIAYGSDKRVTLVWEASTDDKKINHYRISYGLDPANADSVVDTKSPATTWYIQNLENGKEYYFAVSAVDDDGVESVVKSEIASAIPFASEVDTAIPGGAIKPVDDLHGAAIEGAGPPEVSKSGPETMMLIYGTGALSGLIHLLRKRKRK